MSNSKRVFVTGGASGLGRALCERYAKAGWHVCLGDVHEERAHETLAALRTHDQPSHFLRCDVTKTDDLANAATWLADNWGGVDVVINNAGVVATGPIEDVALEDWQWIIDINLLGVVRGCKTFVPVFKKQKSGHLVNIASLAGLVNPPKGAPYNAVKAAVIGLSETLYSELARDGIHVSVVCPSFFRTRLMENARGGSDASRLAKAAVERSKVSADQIAEEVYRGIEQRRFRILPDKIGRHSWRLKCSMPFSLFAPMLRRSLKL